MKKMKKIISFLLIFIMLGMYSTVPMRTYAEKYTPYYSITHNGHIYDFYNIKLSWNDARQYCESVGGHLVVIETAEEKETIRLALGTGTDVWIGAQIIEHAEYSKVNWITNGSSVDRSFINYDLGEPSTLANYIKMYGTDTDDKLHIWNDFDYKCAGFICEIPANSKIKLYSNRPSLSLTEGETFEILVESYINDSIQPFPSNYSFSVKNTDMLKIVDKKLNSDNVLLTLQAINSGLTDFEIMEGNHKLLKSIKITVSPQDKNVYTIYNVPEITIKEVRDEICNFYNFSGLFIDSYQKEINSDKTCSISFNAYNTNKTYGIVEVYNKKGELVDAVVIDKQVNNNTSIQESFWDNLCCLTTDIFEGNLLSYKQSSGYSKKTPVKVDNIPSGGYIKLTASPMESPLLCILNQIDIILSTQDAIDKTATFSQSINKEFFQNIAKQLVKEEGNKLKKLGKDYSKELLKGFSNDMVINGNSIGNFVNTCKKNLSNIEWDKLVINALANQRNSIGETILKKLSGPAGLALDGCFMFGSTSNLIMECNDFVNLVNASSLTIQVPNDSQRVHNEISVTFENNIDSHLALEAYKIDNTDDIKLQNSSILEDSSYLEYYNISMLDNRKEIQITSKAKTSIRLSSSMLKYADNIKAFRYEEDGSLTELNSKILDDADTKRIEFETDHFSSYILAGYDENIDTPNTNINLISVLVGIIQWIATIVMSVLRWLSII